MARTPRLEVRVVVANRGDQPAVPLDVVGELLGERREARVVQGVPAGGEAAVLLDFAAEEARPGLHALALLLEHPVGGAADAAGNPPVHSQRAALIITLGSNPGPAVRIEVACPDDPSDADCGPSIDVQGEIAARLESADGKAHRMKVRALTARGLRAQGPPVTVAVPGTGTATVRIPLARAGGAPGSRHGVLVVAETIDGPLARTTVEEAEVRIAPHPSVVRRLRGPLLLLGLALLASAGLAEWRRRDQA